MLRRSSVTVIHGENRQSISTVGSLKRKGSPLTHPAHAAEPSTSIRPSQEGLAKKMQPKNHQQKKLVRSQLRKRRFPREYQDNNRQEMTFLEKHTITQARLTTYQVAWAELVKFASKKQLSMKSLSQVDSCAAQLLDQKFFGGESLASGMTLLASIKLHRNDVPKLGVLTRSMRAMKGFRKLAPPQARVPLPYPMLAQIMIYVGTILKAPMVSLFGADVELVLPAGRVAKADLGSNSSTKCSEQTVVCPSLNVLPNRRKIGTKQDRRIGRSHRPGPSLSEMDAEKPKQIEESSWSRRPSFSVRFDKGQCDVQPSRRRAWFSKSRHPMCVSDSAWVSFHRHDQTTAEHRRVDEEGAMEVSFVTPSLRAGGKIESSFRQVDGVTTIIALHAEKQVGATMVRLLG